MSGDSEKLTKGVLETCTSKHDNIDHKYISTLNSNIYIKTSDCYLTEMLRQNCLLWSSTGTTVSHLSAAIWHQTTRGHRSEVNVQLLAHSVLRPELLTRKLAISPTVLFLTTSAGKCKISSMTASVRKATAPCCPLSRPISYSSSRRENSTVSPKKREIMGEDPFKIYKHIGTVGTECLQSTTEGVQKIMMALQRVSRPFKLNFTAYFTT